MELQELFKQAQERTVTINRLMGELEVFGVVMQEAAEGKVSVSTGSGATYIDRVLSPEKMQELKDQVIRALEEAGKDKRTELERLVVDRKPAVINKDFEDAVKEMVQQHTKEEIKDAAEEIKNPDIENPPEVADKVRELEVETVKRMYLKRGMSVAEIAAMHGVDKTKVYNFMAKHKIKKPTKKEKELFIDADDMYL